MTSLAAFYTELGSLDLPMPVRAALTESSTGTFMALDLPTMAEAQAWAKFLGAGPLPVHVGTSTRFVYYYGRSAVTVGGLEIGLSAHESIPGEGGGVAGPDGDAGSATTPTETTAVTPDEPGPVPGTYCKHCGAAILKSLIWVHLPDGMPDCGNGKTIAEPDEAAPVPDVWVPIRRRGTNYHRPGEQRSTTCGRNMFPNGVRLPLAEVEAFGAVPCPRCYGGAA